MLIRELCLLDSVIVCEETEKLICNEKRVQFKKIIVFYSGPTIYH